MTKIDNLAHLQARGASAYVFLIKQFYNGNLGGVAGADAKCQEAADAAGLPGLYKAWIADSDPLSAPANRFTQVTGAYVLPPGDGVSDSTEVGEKVADDWTDLTDGDLDHEINVVVDGDTFSLGASVVWSGVNFDGVGGGGPFCDDWTSDTSAIFGAIGLIYSLT